MRLLRKTLRLTEECGSLAFELVGLFQAWMNDLRLEREQDQACVVALACLKGDLDPLFDDSCCNLAIGGCKRFAPNRAISEKRRRLAIVGGLWIFASCVLQQIECGQLDGVGNLRGMEIEGAKRLVERVQVLRSARRRRTGREMSCGGAPLEFKSLWLSRLPVRRRQSQQEHGHLSKMV